MLLRGAGAGVVSAARVNTTGQPLFPQGGWASGGMLQDTKAGAVAYTWERAA